MQIFRQFLKKILQIFIVEREVFLTNMRSQALGRSKYREKYL